MNIDHVARSIRLWANTSPFDDALRRAGQRITIILWSALYGNEYDRATARVVTAIGFERTAP